MTTKTKGKKAGNKAPNTKGQSSNSKPILLIAFGVIAIALITAIVFSSEDPIGSAGEFGEPEVTGPALAAFGNEPTIANDPAVGTPAPTVTGQDFDGNTVSISNDGSPKAVLFVAHWCPHCQNEVPRVQSWLNSGGGVDGVDIFTVSTFASSGQANWPPSAWLSNEGWTAPVIRDDQASTVMTSYGGSSVPYWVFLNGDGTVAFRLGGETDVSTLQLVMETLVTTG